MKKRMICWLMCGAVLVACAGCDNTPDEPTGGETTTVTTVTTTVATTTADSTTPTSTEPTAAPTTTATPTAETRKNRDRTFWLKDRSFTIGSHPKALLDYLGEPLKIESTEENDAHFGDLLTVYAYENAWVETLVLKGTDDERLSRFVTWDEQYDFDGISVGDTAQKLVEVWPDYLENGTRLQGGNGSYNTGRYFQYDFGERATCMVYFKAIPEDSPTDDNYRESMDMTRTIAFIAFSGSTEITA